MVNQLTQDKIFMRQAIKLAKKAHGKTSPNPLVGAVVVRDGVIVGKGFHPQAGNPHAERYALKDAGELANGATIYVTLEPCSTHGRTPPCTEAIIESKIKRVVIGSIDPNPQHAANGIEILKNAGIIVTHGIMQKECDALNEAFFYWIQHKKPFVLLKIGSTIDGKIATENGNSQWITGPKARKEVQKLRQWCDGIMVGGETVRQDNPSLTVREPNNWEDQPQKFIWTRKDEGSFNKSLNIFKDKKSPKFTNCQSSDDWQKWLQEIGEQGITSLLIEGGGQLAAAALKAGIVNKINFFIAPKILGGNNSRTSVGGLSPLSLQESINIQNMKIKKIGDDILISGYPSNICIK